MSEPVRVIILRDGDVFYAQCLEIDVAAQGTSAEEAMKRLKANFRAEIESAREDGRDVSEIGPAPDAFHAVYTSDVVDRTELVA